MTDLTEYRERNDPEPEPERQRSKDDGWRDARDDAPTETKPTERPDTPTDERREIPGREDFDAVGRRLAELAPRGEWEAEDSEGRERMARSIHEHVRAGYGLEPRDLTVSDDMGDDVHGAFTPESGDVAINRRLLENRDPEEAIRTLGHENRHALQDEVIRGKGESPSGSAVESDIWRSAEAEYNGGDFEGRGYAYNALETDARAAGDGVVIGYLHGELGRARESNDPTKGGWR